MPFHSNSGKNARLLAEKRSLKLDLLKLVMLLVGLVFFLMLRNSPALGVGGLLVLVFAYKFIMEWLAGEAKHTRKREKQAIRGAEAEDTIADILSELSGDCRVFNDVSTGSGDIDHVLIKKDGSVFVIETKSHRGKVSFDGTNILINGNPPEKNFIGQVLRNAYWVKDRIKEQTGKEVWVNSILVFTNAFVDRHAPVKGVQVLNKKFLIKYLEGIRAGRYAQEIYEKVML